MGLKKVPRAEFIANKFEPFSMMNEKKKENVVLDQVRRGHDVATVFFLIAIYCHLPLKML